MRISAWFVAGAALLLAGSAMAADPQPQQQPTGKHQLTAKQMDGITAGGSALLPYTSCYCAIGPRTNLRLATQQYGTQNIRP
jgi:hypothetical protein